MQFHLLGTVEVHANARALPVGSPKQATLLAALLIDVGQPLSAETLVDRVWGEAPHHRAQRTLHTYVARIRRLLEALPANNGEVIRRGNGYVLHADPDTIDLHLFRALVDRAGAADRSPVERVDLLREALSLWRGEPLTGLRGEWAGRVRTAWRARHLDAVLAWAHAELRVGNAGAIVGRLAGLVEEHPLVEPLAAVLILALHQTGRSAEALQRYATTRRQLVDALGTEPGQQLQAAHRTVLQGEVPPKAADPPRAPKPARVPAQLPLDVYRFTNREAELATLGAVRTGEESTPVVVISGTAGVGKTALAVHWAHRVRAQFPDGQLYVNLQGFHPTGHAVAAVDALRGFLTALSFPAAQVPVDPASCAALFRSLLADRRVLTILDNAGDADQVRPLLPAAPGCMVLVTSRDRLPGLVAAEGAHPINVDLLRPADARELLVRRVGASRVDAEAGAADEIVHACARLPLALVVAAARAATHPDLPLATLAAELRDTRTGLDAFATGDDANTDVRAVLSWSDQILSPPAGRLFRLLGLHGGPHIAPPAAASLVGLDDGATRRALAEVTRAHLLEESPDGRYTFHDLLRAYAADRVQARESEASRRGALSRVLLHYLHTAYAAERMLYPHRVPIEPVAAARGVSVPPIAGADEAMAWFIAEHRVLLWAVRAAADAELDLVAWQLAWCLTTFFDLQGHWHDWAGTQQTALSAATRLGDRSGQAFAHRNLGLALAQLGRDDDSDRHLETALAAYSELAEYAGQAHTHNTFARVRSNQGRIRDALNHALRASQLFQACGLRSGQSRTLNNVGWYHAQLGEYDQALARCREALALHDEIDDRYGAANTWDSIGLAHHHLHDFGEAVASYRAALRLWREVGDRYNEADTLTRLADTYGAIDDCAAARTALRDALTILEDLDHPDAVEVRAALDDSSSRGCCRCAGPLCR